jgi:hypothetical protein
MTVSSDVSRVTAAIGVLMALAVGLSALPIELGPDAVAVVALPSSFAATVLLTRERSSLAAWVLGPAKTALLILLVVLAALSGLRAMGWQQPDDAAPARPPGGAVTNPTPTAGPGAAPGVGRGAVPRTDREAGPGFGPTAAPNVRFVSDARSIGDVRVRSDARGVPAIPAVVSGRGMGAAAGTGPPGGVGAAGAVGGAIGSTGAAAAPRGFFLAGRVAVL